jgi:hypothetical protein
MYTLGAALALIAPIDARSEFIVSATAVQSLESRIHLPARAASSALTAMTEDYGNSTTCCSIVLFRPAPCSQLVYSPRALLCDTAGPRCCIHTCSLAPAGGPSAYPYRALDALYLLRMHLQYESTSRSISRRQNFNQRITHNTFQALTAASTPTPRFRFRPRPPRHPTRPQCPETLR